MSYPTLRTCVSNSTTHDLLNRIDATRSIESIRDLGGDEREVLEVLETHDEALTLAGRVRWDLIATLLGWPRRRVHAVRDRMRNHLIGRN